MSVRLKFFIAQKSESQWAPNHARSGSVTLRPVVGGSDENKAFYQATPAGEVKFETINQAALDALPLGAEVYIDLTVIEAAVAAA